MAVFMDEITKHTLEQINLLEMRLRVCERQFARIGRAKVPVYFGMPDRAREGFVCLYQALQEMRFVLTGQGFPPEG